MANFYSHQKKTMGELVRQASSSTESGATILIPDLQRPYVWTPNQVVLLMDSIIRGWPFGTFLFWRLKDADLHRFPHRCFYRMVDRTNDEDGDIVDMQQPPAEYFMVLDGQQRLQSLLLAVGGDEWGFKLEDTDWAMELHERKTRKTSTNHWSRASLCLDVSKFMDEYSANQEKLLAVNFRNVLCWLITKPVGGQSESRKPDNYEETLLKLYEPANEGKFIRFSRIWHAVKEDAQLKEKDFKYQLEDLLKKWEVPEQMRGKLTEPLAELMSTIRDIKMSDVSFLQVNSYSEIWSQDDYNDAIVNIFTRLNSAGRTLTREEITMAWLKTGWKEASRSFNELRADLEEFKLPIEMDELVGMISFLWAMQKRNGALLDNRDLLNQQVIKPMAEDLSLNWVAIRAALMSTMRLLQERKLRYGKSEQYSSLYSLVVIWALFYLVELWKKNRTIRNMEKDDFEMKVLSCLDGFVDRWIFGSHWADRWSIGLVKNVADYARQLATDWAKLEMLGNPADAVQILQARTKELLGGIESDACNGIDAIQASSRSRVSVYRNYLWIWHRLEANRWDMTRIVLKTGRRVALSADVDHCVAYKLWERKVEKECQCIDESEKRDLINFVNKIGNCTLLEKTFNISKDDNQLNDFIQQIHEFKQGKDSHKWADALLLDRTLMQPATETLAGIQEAIERRDAVIRSELKEFIRGQMARVDVKSLTEADLLGS